MCDCRIHNDRAGRSASLRQWSCPFYSSRAGFFLAKNHITQVRQPPLQPRFGFLRLTDLPRAKFAFEREEISECDGHTIHKLSQRHLTADWLAPWESDCSRIRSKVSSDWLPSYIKTTRPVLEIFKMAGYFPDRPRIYQYQTEGVQRFLRVLHRKITYVYIFNTPKDYHQLVFEKNLR